MFHIVTAQVTNFFFVVVFFDQWEWRNHLTVRRKNCCCCLSEEKWNDWFSDYCTVESFVYIINILYRPLNHWGLLMFFLVLCNFCQYILVIMSFCILCYVAKARRIYLDVSLTKCLYSFLLLCCICIENENQVHEGFLFIWQAFWTDNHSEM